MRGVSQVPAIIAEVAAARGLAVADMLGRRRFGPLVRARQEAFSRCYELQTEFCGPYSLKSIGRWFDRDHTTVLHGIREHRRRSPGSFETCQTLSEPESGLA